MLLTLKLLHLAAVIMFLGNITTGLFWHAHAARTKDPRLLAHAMDGIIRSDRWFTVPSVIVLVAAGVGLAVLGHLPLLRTPWILWSVVAMTVSGVIFVARIAPLQRELFALASAAGLEGFDYAKYRARTIAWEIWGALALVTPLAAFCLMVFKPSF